MDRRTGCADSHAAFRDGPREASRAASGFANSQANSPPALLRPSPHAVVFERLSATCAAFLRPPSRAGERLSFGAGTLDLLRGAIQVPCALSRVEQQDRG